RDIEETSGGWRAVTSKQGQPGFSLRVLLVACGLDAGLVAPFHLFTRTRGYFENTTIFDFVLIGIGVFIGILVLSVIKGRTFWVTAASAAGMAVVGFLTIVQYPALEYTSQTIPLVDFLGVETQPMALNYAAIACLAILLCGGMLEACSRSGAGEGGLVFPAALALGAGIHFFTTLLVPSTTGLMLSLAASATGLIALLGKGSGTLLPWLSAKPSPLPVPRARHVAMGFTGTVSWLLSAGVGLLAMLVFFGHLKIPVDLVNGSLLFSNVIFGAAVAAIIALITRKWRVWGSISAIAFGGAGLALLFYMASAGALVAFPAIALGIPLVLPSWHVVSELAQAGARGTTGVLLLVGWLIAAYLAFIPIKLPDLAAFSEWIYLVAASVTAVEVGLSILRAYLARGARWYRSLRAA
ncbi:MAG: hypothetical protein JW839_06825, partial [Candidatus Lokiarchaeota archaeon]|nr:hypothetical protein [Candidatus Lokiarchaeota archaeon]